MNLFDIILLAIALAMDCFAVSIVSGLLASSQMLVAQSFGTYKEIRMAFFFGFFQAMMPLLGWLGISYFQSMIEAYDHWIAFSLLLFIGGNMIREAFGPEEEQHFNPANLHTQLVLAVATSIDALAIGISFACTGYERLSQLTMPLVIIGVVSFAFSIIGTRVGSRFGGAISRRLKPALFGGVILIMIGVKILVSHLMNL
jgi:putative Mn2+ efflux pump MntP